MSQTMKPRNTLQLPRICSTHQIMMPQLYLVPAGIPPEVLDQLVEVLFLLLVRDRRIVKAKSQTLHGPVLQVTPEEVRHEEGKALEQKEKADPLVVVLENDVVFLVDRMIWTNT